MKWILVLVLVGLAACTRAPVKDKEQAMRAADAAPEVQDSLDFESLRVSIQESIRALDKLSGDQELVFGDRRVRASVYKEALSRLGQDAKDLTQFQALVKERFDFFEVYGDTKWGEIFSTGYYQPLFKGSRKRSKRFTSPLYQTPSDLVALDVGKFAEKFPDIKAFQDMVAEKRFRIAGRLIPETRKVVPYYERGEIASAKNLEGKGLEIVWLQPVDAFFLEIQGSGMIELDNGETISVTYADQNGYQYQAIGKYLLDVIPLEQMSMQRIRAHLETLPPARQQEILNKNPSYVFFREARADTYSGAAPTAGRTIATDKNLFPKGALAYMEIEEPEFADAAAIDPASWVPRPRFVLDQDTGGAIKGGGRVDLYYGHDAAAERKAGVMKRAGRLWYLVPKVISVVEASAE